MTKPEPETFEVDPARLQYGIWNHAKDRDEHEGDIRGSYSADVIAFEGRVRKPFKWQGSLCVSTGSAGRSLTKSGREEFEAYRLVPVRMFDGSPTSYGEKTGTCEAAEVARNDPMGLYHGINVSRGKDGYVLCGPPLCLVSYHPPERPGSTSGPSEQLSLF